MPFIGPKPADTVLDSTLIADGSITSAKIADGAIVNADLNNSAAIATSKITGLAASATTDTTNAANIASGTIADARISASSVQQHATSFDDNKLVNDISALALRQSSNENKAAYNTQSMYVDVFQDATGITGLTNCSRDSNEFVSTVYQSTGQYTSDSNTLLLLHGDGSDNGTTFTDSSSNNRSAIVTGSVVTKTGIKKYGTASIYFGDGDGSAGSHGNSLSWADSTDWNAGTNEWTVECWTYITAYPTTGNSSFEYGGQAYSDSTDNGGSYHMSLQQNQQFQHNTYNRGGTGDNTGNYAYASGSSHTVPLNTWTHLAWTRQSNTIRLYKNGVQANTGAIDSTASYKMLHNNDLGGKWWLSRRAYNSNYGYIRGYVDEYRVSNNNRYPDGTSFTPGTFTSSSATGSFTSNNITAPSSTSKMGAIITYQDNAGTNALNTDIVLKLSANGGSSYSTATLTAMPDFATGIKMAKVNDLSVTAGTSLKYKLEFANQASGSKEARIRGVSLQY